MRSLKRITAVGVSTAALLLSSLSGAPSASAHHFRGLWLGEHQNQEGTLYGLTVSDSWLWNNGSGWNDRASSVKNTSGVAWVLYDDSGYQGRHYCIYGYQEISDLHASKWEFGDKISSVKRLSTNSCRGYPRF